MKQQYLGPQNTEDLGRMLLALLSEVWIMRDRMAVLEQMLADKNEVSSQAIDDYVPSPELEEKLRVLRDRMATNVIAAPLLAENRSVDDILRHAGLPPRQTKQPA